ncbi:hypothetical protein M3Y96_00483200 [Aphelenchoides besseyi]|nr:hypothetical protein M3Y96_00483200 [Aphelenchoides besseyi]
MCSKCHQLTQTPGEPKTGPTLKIVLGRKSHQLRYFDYSEAIKKQSEISECYLETLYLDNLNKYILGNKVGFRWAQAGTRARQSYNVHRGRSQPGKSADRRCA